MSIKAKILIPTIAAVLFVAVAILLANSAQFSDFASQTAINKVGLATRVAESNLEAFKAKSAAASLSLAQDPEIIAAVAAGDRAALLGVAEAALGTETGVFSTFTDAEGNVLARTHEKETYGDSVADQNNIRLALSGTPVTVVEEGTAIRLSIRSSAPVRDAEGTLIGVACVGFRLDDPTFVDLIHELTGCETTIFLGDERVSTTILLADGTRAVGTKAEPRVSEMVLAGDSYSGEADVLGRTAVTRYLPIADANGQTLGMLFVGQYTDTTGETTGAFVRVGSLITALILLMAIAAILTIAARILAPVRAMTRAATVLASGDIDLNIQVGTSDEMRTLADAFNRMIDNTRRQVRITEQIAAGNLQIPLEPRSEKDLMNHALQKLNETIRAQAASILAENTRVNLMLDAMPLACRLWTRDFRLLACNEASVRLFRLENKQAYIERFYELSPETQPDTGAPRAYIQQMIALAFAQGSCAYKWVYRLPDGEPLPADVTLVRVPYGDDFVVAAYSRDLREEKRMLADIERRDHLLALANHTAFALFAAPEDEDVGAALMEAMRQLGQCVLADYIHILQLAEGEASRHFVCRYAWSGNPGEAYPLFGSGAKLPYGDDLDLADGPFCEDGMSGPLRVFPETLRGFFAALDAKSALVVPIRVEDRFWGLVCFADRKTERAAKEDEARILRSMSLMMAITIHRNEQSAKIREAHRRIRLLTNATPLGFNLWDKNRRNIETNDTSVALFGLGSQREYLARFAELSPEYQPDGRPSAEKMAEVLDTAFRDGFCAFEWTHRHPDGTPLPAHVTLVRLRYAGDYVVAGYLRDMREEIKMLDAIHRRDHLLQTVNRTADILLRAETGDFDDTLRACMGTLGEAIRADRVYIAKSRAEDRPFRYTRLYEWTSPGLNAREGDAVCGVTREGAPPTLPGTLSGGACVRALAREMTPADRAWLGMEDGVSVLIVPVFLQAALFGFVGFENCRAEQPFSENEASVMRSGSLLLTSALLRNEYLLHVKEASAKLEIALADAKSANQAKTTFLAHMSHEMRTPLNAILGFSELMLGEGTLRAQAESTLEKIYGAGSTLLSIVNDILDISKIESGKFELFPVRYDTPSLINDTVTLNIMRIGEKPITFSLVVDENLPGTLLGDDLRVKQIFNNLLSNAFKYTKRGSVEWRLTFETAGDEIFLISKVRDTGIGITPEDMQNLFADYHQAVLKMNRAVEGTGLGLAIAKRLVEMMGGTITLQSEYGKGTEVDVRIRQKVASDAPIGKKVADNLMGLRYSLSKRAQNTKLARVNLSYARVLVVDDIATNLDVVKGMLKPYAAKVDCAGSGPQAIAMIRAGQPRYDAVFMDHMMPEMDGIEAVRIIRNDIGTDYARNLPIIALTANAIVGSEKMFLAEGFQDFISKPIDLGKLDAALRRWVRNKDKEKAAVAGEKGARPALAPGASGEGGGPGENGAPLFEGLSIQGVNLYEGLRRFGGNDAVYADVLRAYVGNTPSLLADLDEQLTAENLKDYAIVIHGVKGASYGICAQEIGRAAEALELFAKAGDLHAVRGAHAAFVSQMAALFDSLSRALEKISAATAKPARDRPDPVLLEALREACRAFDMDAVDSAMARLEAFQYARGARTVAWLREQVAGMAFETIAEGAWPTE